MKNLIGNLPPPHPFWAELARRFRRERGFVAFVLLTFAIAWAFLLVHDNYVKLCAFAERSRNNQITSAVEQAQTLVDFAVMNMLEEGVPPDDPDLVRTRDVTGPAYVARIRENHERRLPPVDKFCEALR